MKKRSFKISSLFILSLILISSSYMVAQQNITIVTSGSENIGWTNIYGNSANTSGPCWTGGATGTWTYTSSTNAWVITGKNVAKAAYDSIAWQGIIPGDCSGQIQLNMSSNVNKFVKIKIRSLGTTTPAVIRFALLDNTGKPTNCDTCLAEITGLTNVFQEYSFDFNKKFHKQYSSSANVDSTKISAYMLTIDAGVATSNASGYKIEVQSVEIGSAAYTPTTETEKSSAEFSNTISPNPVSDQLNVKVNLSDPRNLKIIITNMMGQPVKKFEEGMVSSLEKSYSVSSLPQGSYFISFYDNDLLLSSKLVIVNH